MAKNGGNGGTLVEHGRKTVENDGTMLETWSKHGGKFIMENCEIQ